MTDLMPWVEKYRPQSLSEVTAQGSTTSVLEKSLHNANLPHMLFYGPPGTGKTSTILALARQLYGPHLMRQCVLELNASDERGISIVRDRIKNFARLTVPKPSEEDAAKYPCPPYKLIILDEADSMTNDAQSALRRTMENYAGVTRFCLICNYVTRIIDPLASRCTKFRFKSLDEDLSLDRLKYISQEEKLGIDDHTLREILIVCEGDLRRAVNLLQSVSTIILQQGQTISQGQIREMFGHLPTELIEKLITVVQSHDLNSLMAFINSDIIMQGYSGSFVLSALHEELILKEGSISLSLNNSQKNSIAHVLWQADKAISQGSNESIQLYNCLFKLSKIL